MSYIDKLRRQLLIRTLLVTMVPTLQAILVWLICVELGVNLIISAIAAGLVGLLSGAFGGVLLSKTASKPIETIADVISYASHDNAGSVAPNLEELEIGQDLVHGMSAQIYDLATTATAQSGVNTLTSASSQPLETGVNSHPMQALTPSVLDHIGMPIFGIDANQNITAVNRTANEYVGQPTEKMIGKPFYDAVKLRFQTEETLEKWLKEIGDHAVTEVRLWERVRLVDDKGETAKQFDLVASYSKDSASGTETVLAIYDRTKQYGQDDKEVGFVALAVHELRTPLTIMRGYIEVFEDELGPNLTPEMTEFMHKMHASAQQLTAFVGNILNVARVEENQLVLKLRSESWQEILQTAVADLELRAKVHGKHIELKVMPDLPAVAVDRISVHEVINNLVDNAIKYSSSDEASTITVAAQLNADGMIETSVQDHGIGIPQAVMPDLFQKFHRSHKSRVQIGGTGLGLYLCKALVTAHGGNIWVSSKEDEGSTFTFTLLPFDKLSKEQAAGEDGIIRGAHGWIKNHSMYRG